MKKENGWVLVIDDEPDLVELIETKLRAEGIGVVSCGKVSEARAKITRQKFDCILLDMQLEQGSGEDIIDFVRLDKKGFNYSTPICVVSGTLDKHLIKEIASEIQGVLSKPFRIDDLVGKVKTVAPNLAKIS